MSFRIEPIGSEKIEPFLQHVARHMAESGRGSTPIFAPYSGQDPWDAESRRQQTVDRLAKSVIECNWERAWAAYDAGIIVAHLDLRARGLPTSLHRATIGMGVEETHRRRGLGKALIETALTWAKGQPSLRWIDLNVFAHNEAAKSLYSSCGFTEIGRMNDLFRVDGHVIDDIQMTLKI